MPAENYNPPYKGQAFAFGTPLEDFANPGRFKSNPTIATGDWKVSKDGGAFANLTTLPSAIPASGARVQIDLSSTEMDAHMVTIIGIDQTSPPEWSDFFMEILTVTAP